MGNRLVFLGLHICKDNTATVGLLRKAYERKYPALFSFARLVEVEWIKLS